MRCRVLARRHHCGIVAALLWESSLLGVAAAIAAASIRISSISNNFSDLILSSFDLFSSSLYEELFGGCVVRRVLVHLNVSSRLFLHPVDRLSFLSDNKTALICGHVEDILHTSGSSIVLLLHFSEEILDATFDLSDLFLGSLDDEVSVPWSVRINCIELNFSPCFGLQSFDRIATSSDNNPHIFLAYCEVRSSLEGSLVLIEVTTSAALSTVVISVVILLLLNNSTDKLSSFLNLERSTMHSERFLRGVSVHAILNHVHLATTLNSEVLDRLASPSDNKTDFILRYEHVNSLDLTHLLHHLWAVRSGDSSDRSLGSVLVDDLFNLIFAVLNTLPVTSNYLLYS